MKPRVVLIIQARMGSSRLPGKSMMNLYGVPLVGRILERVKRCKSLHDIVLAVPDTENDLVLIDLADKYSVRSYAGSENNLIERFYQAALQFNADYIVRLPADNPTPEPDEIDRIINHHIALDHPGFSSNLAAIGNSEYPDGIGAEIFSFSLLEEVRSKKPDKQKQEHIHLNFFDYNTGLAVDQSWCPISTLKCPAGFRRPDLVLDVNTSEQYHFMCELYDYLYPINANFNIVDIIKWYDEIYLKSHSVSPQSL